MPDPDDYFDDRIAARYDEKWAELFDPAVLDPAIDFLVENARDGRALELGVGTGRIAIPLAGRGVPVYGIELSRAMAARLRAKPGGEDVGVTIGNFATATVEGSFSLAYLVRNTIMNLTNQAAQVACFRNVAAHLEPGGRFVIEVMVPALQRLPPGDTFRVFKAEKDYWGIDEYDVVNQGLVSHHLEIVDGQVERFSVPFGMYGPRSSTLWRSLPECGCASAGPGGDGSPSRAAATSTCRSGRSRKRRRPDRRECRSSYAKQAHALIAGGPTVGAGTSSLPAA